MGDDLEIRIAELENELEELRDLKQSESKFYVVRLYDGFDNMWMDVSKPVSKDEAQRIWDEKTDGGTRNTSYDDIDYYHIYPADTVMHFSYEAKELRDKKGR